MADSGPIEDTPTTQPTGAASPAAAAATGQGPGPSPANPAAVVTGTLAEAPRSPLAAIADDLRGVAPASSIPTECLAIAANLEAGVYARGDGDLATDLARIGCPERDRRAICARADVPEEPRIATADSDDEDDDDLRNVLDDDDDDD